MKAILLLSMIMIISMQFGPPAAAGAATGMPSPFLLPYPDFGYCGKCLWPRYPVIAGHTVGHSPMRTRAPHSR